MLRYILRIAGRHIALAIVLGLLWLALSGEEHWGNPTLAVFGAGSVLLCVWLADRAGMLDREGVPTRIFPGILSYMFWLTLEIGKANVAVVRHALSPKLSLSPGMLRVPAYQASDMGKTIFANSITLTPGTVTVDVYEGSILVHALTEELADVDGITSMGERVCALDVPEGREWARQKRLEAMQPAAQRQDNS
ncbi:Na+/H+ antiporter subunit E [Parvularcula sp. IMCC14364]|uniref:Na+/H+ antiporter subunit E n=1 Tax=Parvularcula sp. IMCC14364 TaxID=3067902 RepID=UPI0027422143|nr:Na+/H+ antiporter subunit E [Parvularcula sp. IMCC14364]